MDIIKNCCVAYVEKKTLSDEIYLKNVINFGFVASHEPVVEYVHITAH